MPLAIELAAARVAALSLDQIAARLGDSLDVLAGGSRTARTRQQTLRATIEWSHDLLTGEERVLFRRLAVFAGGFTLEAAEDVCAGGAIARRRIVDLVARLVDKSLVSRDRTGASACSTPSASTPPSASTRPPSTTTVAVRHLDWCLALAEEHDPLSAGPRRSLRTLETEHDNLRAALTFALRRDPQAALRLATSLWRFWLDRGYFAEGNRWLEATLVAAPERDRAARRGPAGQRRALAAQRRLRPRTCAARSRRSPTTASWATSTPPPRPSTSTRCSSSRSATPRAPTALFADAIALARRLGDRAPAGRRHARIGHDAVVPLRHASRPARSSTRRSRSSRRSPTTTRPSSTCVTFGLCLLHDGPQGAAAPALRGDDLPLPSLRPRPGHRLRAQQPGLDRARDGRHRARPRAALDEALERFRAIEDRRGEALTLNHMGNLARTQGDLDAGRAHLRAALELRRELGEKRAILMSTMCAGRARDRARGDVARGRELLGEALARAEAVDDLPAMAGVQTNWGLAEERRGDLERAERAAGRRRARCGACSSCGASRAGRRSRCATCASASATRPGAQRALDAARELLADSEDARRRALSRDKGAR